MINWHQWSAIISASHPEVSLKNSNRKIFLVSLTSTNTSGHQCPRKVRWPEIQIYADTWAMANGLGSKN